MVIRSSFEDGKALSALDRCIGTQIKEIGKPDFTHQIVLCLPEVLPGQKIGEKWMASQWTFPDKRIR